ncbi:MAG: LON peptidase substrate-binding domain-containing protein [Gammaproteobacteria bacterium]|nr:LON peptidase substrate-binding domain-containing protein [Gammaproteobacteria bacterium]MDP2142373.1 LON peptidase substrate-binding domain-containing protein [Gammaproteobacteria bacterium]MDP2348614.1 LON peptidase substrate-binding domain-containing protein [Gammaproteobacteria bacterium]
MTETKAESITRRGAETIALFPLKSVLFPGGRLPLQIFEQRYLNLVSQALKTDTGFGICLLKDGDEVAKAGVKQQVHRVGTYARVVDWDQLPNGLLGVTVEGHHKFVVQECWSEKDQLLMGNVDYCSVDFLGEAPISVEEEHDVLISLLQQLASHPVISKLGMNIDYEDLRQLGWRLSELIPLTLERKQSLLELQDPHERIRALETIIDTMIQDG